MCDKALIQVMDGLTGKDRKMCRKGYNDGKNGYPDINKLSDESYASGYFAGLEVSDDD